MKSSIQRFIRILKQIGIRSLAAALGVMLITAGLATYIGIRISEKERQVLQLQGELNAKESAMEYNRCLLTRANIVTLVGFAVDTMLASGRDNQDILKYITDESSSITATLDPSSTGLYGWIGEEYLDGVGWVPDDDFVATERPWYTETMESDENITFVEPYLDLQTNTVMMTVTQRLSDGKSVIAMDVSLEPIQQIVEHVAEEFEDSQAFVLDTNGIVVAHSDEKQLGLNYLEDPDSLGGAVAQKILKEGRMQFNLRTSEGNFSTYVDRLEGGWYSVSLINSDTWHRPLRRTMIIFFGILALVMAFLVFVFLRLYTKNRVMQRLNTQISLEEKRGKEWKALSETDRMTGLSDRVSGERMISDLLTAGSGGMFVELDVDHFKNINDTCGHQTGDQVIHLMADSLRNTFRTNDILMRLGGDEFGVFAVGVTSRDMGEALIHRLFDRLESSSIPELPEGKIHVSAGAAIHTGESEASFSELYASADSAMYESKEKSGNSLTFQRNRKQNV